MDATSFEQAVRAFGDRVGGVASGGWSAPTPCGDWDVRALVSHVVGELLWVPPLLAGQTIAEVGDRFEGDVLGDDPRAAYAGAAAGALEAAGRPGAREAVAHLSFGDFSGADYLSQIGTDVVIHGWDLSRGSGQPDDIDEALVEEVFDFLAPQAEAWRSAGAFGPALEVPPTATTKERLLAITGRRA